MKFEGMTKDEAVVPHAGTWIEIGMYEYMHPGIMSFPTRERGLKFVSLLTLSGINTVVPHTGMWIEIGLSIAYHLFRQSFSTRNRYLT